MLIDARTRSIVVEESGAWRQKQKSDATASAKKKKLQSCWLTQIATARTKTPPRPSPPPLSPHLVTASNTVVSAGVSASRAVVASSPAPRLSPSGEMGCKLRPCIRGWSTRTLVLMHFACCLRVLRQLRQLRQAAGLRGVFEKDGYKVDERSGVNLSPPPPGRTRALPYRASPVETW